MEFLKSNFFDTATQLTVTTGSLTGSNLLNPDVRKQYVSIGDNSDLTVTSLSIVFGSTVNVSRIGLKGINWKSFTLFFDAATANVFALSTTSDTITTDYATNSETSMFFNVTPQLCTSLTFDIKTTQVANAEKVLSYLVVSDTELEFARIPSAKNYKPRIASKQVIHKMSDGSIRIHTIQDKLKCEVKYKFISEAFRDNLKSVYDKHSDFVFVAFGTTTSWDEVMAPVVWSGPFDFFRFSDNAATAGFSGKIKIDETTI